MDVLIATTGFEDLFARQTRFRHDRRHGEADVHADGTIKGADKKQTSSGCQ